MALKSRLLGCIEGLDQRIDAELDLLRDHPIQTCHRYAVGPWGKWVLFTDESGWEAIATDTPALRILIESVCDMTALRVAHVFFSAEGGFLHPHRDWQEAAPLFQRVHLPLRADHHSFISEARTLFRMVPGEAWLLCASEVHSAGCFSSWPRYHLVLDFCADTPIERALALVASGSSKDPAVRRPEWSEDKEAAFLNLSHLLDETTLAGVIDLASALHFDWELDCEASWELLSRVTALSGKAELSKEVEFLSSRFLCREESPSEA